MAARVAVIGGTGVYNPEILSGVREEVVQNKFGSAKLAVGSYKGQEMVFLARHGATHSVPPHLVNYRANVWALKEMGVERIIATAAVGSLNQAMAPGHFVFMDQFLDFTKLRPVTFFEGGEMGVVHTDMTAPYCPQIRGVLAEAAAELAIPATNGGTYVCAEGPRFETPAEIRMYRLMGGDLVGMTSVPEVVLARELGLCYATIAMVTNFAAGISPTELTHQEVLDTMAANGSKLNRLLMLAAERLPQEHSCRCRPQEAGK